MDLPSSSPSRIRCSPSAKGEFFCILTSDDCPQTLLAERSPPRPSRRRIALTDEAGNGLTLHKAANACAIDRTHRQPHVRAELVEQYRIGYAMICPATVSAAQASCRVQQFHDSAANVCPAGAVCSEVAPSRRRRPPAIQSLACSARGVTTTTEVRKRTRL